MCVGARACVCAHVFKGVFSNPGLYCAVVQREVNQLFYCGCDLQGGDNQSELCGKNQSQQEEVITDRNCLSVGKFTGQRFSCFSVVHL